MFMTGSFREEVVALEADLRRARDERDTAVRGERYARLEASKLSLGDLAARWEIDSLAFTARVAVELGLRLHDRDELGNRLGLLDRWSIDQVVAAEEKAATRLGIDAIKKKVKIDAVLDREATK